MIFIFRNVAFRTIFSDIVNWCAKFVKHSCIEKWSLSSMGISPINLDWNLGVEIVFEDTVTLLTVQSTISKEFYPTRRWWATKNTIENIKSFNYTFSSPATVFYCRVQKKNGLVVCRTVQSDHITRKSRWLWLMKTNELHRYWTRIAPVLEQYYVFSLFSFFLLFSSKCISTYGAFPR